MGLFAVFSVIMEAERGAILTAFLPSSPRLAESMDWIWERAGFEPSVPVYSVRQINNRAILWGEGIPLI
jgi:hypothetical protein